MFWENSSGMNCGNVACIFATEDDTEIKECGILMYVHTQHSFSVLDSFSCVCVCVCTHKRICMCVWIATVYGCKFMYEFT